jgi:hypothetical protein
VIRASATFKGASLSSRLHMCTAWMLHYVAALSQSWSTCMFKEYALKSCFFGCWGVWCCSPHGPQEPVDQRPTTFNGHLGGDAVTPLLTMGCCVSALYQSQPVRAAIPAGRWFAASLVLQHARGFL